jgi:hypothetical protein
VALGVSFSVCLATGLVSHALQHPPPWFHWPARPVNLYRITQGVHVLTGIGSIPLLLAKLWVVYPKLFEWPPVRGVVHALERLSLLVLIAGALFLLFTGTINVAYYYSPMAFFFPVAHFWAAWITIGALVVHIGAKLPVTSRALSRSGADVRGGTTAPGLSRRGFLATTAGGAGLLVATVAGETVRPLSALAVLAPRRPDRGPQRLPVNRSAVEAGVMGAALDPGYRLTVQGRGTTPTVWAISDLQAMPQRSAGLPISCVEGWSASASWRGVPLRHLLDLAGAPAGAAVRVESLELRGLYRASVVDAAHAGDDDTLLALELNGSPLDLDHGYPVRLIAPNRPGVLQTKWVTRVVVL